MVQIESAAGDEIAFGWKTYSVSRSGKQPLLNFITRALEMRGCIILSASEARYAPFYIVFETPAGERQGVLAYAFLANTKLTRNRPDDEHRFQIKYGKELKGILEVAIDPHKLVTTIFVGIDPRRGIFIAADPVMNNPSPMSRSIEFKAAHVEEIMKVGWASWERDRRPPKTKTRPTPDFNEDMRIQVLVGGKQDRLFDLIQLERLARGLDTGERHLLADTLLTRPTETVSQKAKHALLTELDLPPDALFDLIDGASRLKMAVRGWVAETHLEAALKNVPGVSECHRIEGEGKPDLALRWKGGRPIYVECKNVLRKTNADGHPRVDFQRTRASKEDPCSRYYQSSDFSVLAACLHAVRGKWQFSFALTCELPSHRTCPDRITNNVVVTAPIFTERPELVFDKCS